MRLAQFAAMLLLMMSCQSAQLDKPKNLIPEEQMVDIFYDLALLEAVRSHQPATYERATNATRYVYDKYRIDSLQFVNSHAYYTQDLTKYRAMYEQVRMRLEERIKTAEAELGTTQEPAQPNAKQPLGDQPMVK